MIPSGELQSVMRGNTRLLVGADSQIYESENSRITVEPLDGIPDGFGDTNDFNIPYGSEYSFFMAVPATAIQYLGTSSMETRLRILKINIDSFLFHVRANQYRCRVCGWQAGLVHSAIRWRNVETDGFNVDRRQLSPVCYEAAQQLHTDRSWGQDLAGVQRDWL